MNLAREYAAWMELDCVCETPPLPVARDLPAWELQARWFAGEFGRTFLTTTRERVEILHCGAWNREHGPHFTDVIISFSGNPPVRGAVEVNAHAQDWAARACGAEFEKVALHFFADASDYFETLSPGGRAIPQVRLDVSRLEFAAAGNSRRSSARPKAGGCAAMLSALSPAQLAHLLEAAAQFRLCRKAERLARLAGQTSPEEGLYQALAETLGYRQNKLPFLLLAQRFPLALLRPRREEIEPLLFAASGFLPLTDLGAMAGETRGFLKEIWGRWWPLRTEFENLMLPPKIWKLAGIRPVNHPQRRLAALAEIVRNWPVIQTLATQGDPAAIRHFFSQLRHRYWDHHYTLTSKRSPSRMALVGPDRVTDMLANVFFPAAIAAAPRFWAHYRKMPAQDSNQRVEWASHRLLPSHPAAPELLKLTMFQQGLLQLAEDYCAACDNDCARCRLPERLERWPG